MTGLREEIRQRVLAAGAHAVGFAAAGEVDGDDTALFGRWREGGRHASMQYMERYDDVRRDPRLLLDGARTLIVALFSYHSGQTCGAVPRIAEYARGRDYHLELRERLAGVGEWLCREHGGAVRACVDTAPLRERYWAVRAGLGFCGRNGQLTRPGEGAGFFIATLLWTGSVEPDEPWRGDGCGDCRRCVEACPGRALAGDGSVDARRCISYLTIESRDSIPEGTNLAGNLYGCDVCRRVCPHAAGAPTTLVAAFAPREDLCAMSLDDWMNITPGNFKRLTRDSAMSRVRLDHLKATARRLSEK